MNLFKKLILTLCVTAIVTSVFADTTAKYPPDAREQTPAILNNTYFGLGIGYTDIPYSNSNFINGQQATSFSNPNVGLNVFLGHYFNRYLAAELSLMRPIEWSYAYGVSTPGGRNSIWTSLFGISLRPTLPLTQRISIYGLAGLGIASRHGFTNNNNVTAIPSEDVATFLTGGGVTFSLSQYWRWNLGVEYSFARADESQPAMLYAYTGFYYLFHKRDLPQYYPNHYIFHKNLIYVGGFSTQVFNPDVNKYFTVHYLPIFWTGDLNTQSGGWVMYQRNVFHTHKRFSFDWGVSISTYNSAVNDSSFQAISIYPAIRWWFFRSNPADIYFFYSIAGPTYLTRDNMDNVYLGGHFSFQDLLGIGFFLGPEKNVNVSAIIGHYSNGNLLPNNPGVQIPMVISVGWAFG
jgi:opacity protein-like surface antigen